MNSRFNPAALFERFGLLILLIAVFVYFSVGSHSAVFDSSANIKNVLSNESVLGILVIATLIPLVAGQIDLSIGPAAGLGSVLCAGLMSKSGWPLGAAAAASLGTGIAIGLVNGLLVAKAGINSIITTLGTSSIIGALVLAYTGGLTIVSGISPKLTEIGSGDWFGVPKPFYFLVLAAAIVWYVLDCIPAGKNLYAAGSSPRAAELVGLNVPRLILGSFVAGGALAGATGVLLVAVQGTGNPQIGENYTLPAIAAAFLGATTIKPGRYNVPGAITAVFFLAFSVNGLTLSGAAPWVSDAFNGVALIAGVGIAVYSRKRRERRRPPDSSAGSDPEPAATGEAGAAVESAATG
jgi:ribose transport system permease protein